MTSLCRPGSPGSWSPDLKRPRGMGLSIWGGVRGTDKNSTGVGMSHGAGTGPFHAAGLPVAGRVSALPEERGSDPASCWWHRRKRNNSCPHKLSFSFHIPCPIPLPFDFCLPACLKQRGENTCSSLRELPRHLDHHRLLSFCPENLS